VQLLGWHTPFVSFTHQRCKNGASFLAHKSAQHDGERGHLPERTLELFPGESARKRLGIPMFMGKVT
jgi:hypothetical protein